MCDARARLRVRLLHPALALVYRREPDATDRWWRSRGADRIDVHGAWRCRSPEELEAVLRIEFPDDAVDRHLRRHAGRSSIEYGFALFIWRPGTGRR